MSQQKRDAAAAALAGFVAHYKTHNDRFEASLNAADEAKRKRQLERLTAVDGRGEDRQHLGRR